ncbi:MAG: fumarylacetoacetase [Gemmatimonadetes bacterium]|nr:fumarylacetoacetase [Gemmatimonadota bacterium]
MTTLSSGQLDETHRADLVSWVESAQDEGEDFPIQNLPLGCFVARGAAAHPGMAIGKQILDLAASAEAGLFDATTVAVIRDCVRSASLNPIMASGRVALRRLRHAASALLRTDTAEGSRARAVRDRILVPMTDAELLLPARVGDYTDFYASLHHATNVGSMFRPDNPLLPNYKWVPIGYHGRASSLVASGTPVRRPSGQSKDDGAAAPSFGPTRRLDYELEVGVFIGAGNALGSAITIGDAESHVAGLCLVNDWSARDIQAWEYQPLGPFLAKNFATTVSPWIVTLDALAPFRAPAFTRAADDPTPLPYLADDGNRRAGGIDITLEVLLSSSHMRRDGVSAARVSLGSFTSMYWTVAQLVTHHASNGCSLLPGDLLASGTVSGASKESRGCLLERTWRGTEPLTLPTGELRRFLEDGDEVIMRGWCERDGYRRIGFGECRGVVQPAN